MKRVHESVDYIVPPERKMQHFYDYSWARGVNPPLKQLGSIRIEKYSFVKKQNTAQYTIFKIKVASPTESWTVWRRYSEFVVLHEKLGKQVDFEIPPLPPKKMFGHFSKDFLTKRQRELEAWLQKILLGPQQRVPLHNACIQTFLRTNAVDVSSPGKNEPSLVVSVPKPSVSSASSTHSQEQGANVSKVESDNEELDVITDLPNPMKGLNPLDELNPTTGAQKEEIKKPGLEDFEMVRVLGKGSFGKVILCRKKDTRKLYAIKVLKKRHILKKKQVRHAKTERSVLEYLDHPFIVKLHYAFQTGEKLHFVIDYLPGGELFFHLGKHGRFDERLGKFYSAEIALALGHLHSQQVVYRDLKPENILLDSDGHIKLADFGLSKEEIRSSTEGSNSFCGTPEYLAPEVLNRSGHGTAVDWWSLGALLYEMLTGLPPWYSQDKRKLFASIQRSELRFPGYVSQGAQRILEAFLERDASIRLGSKEDVEEVKAHPFFQSIDWDALYHKRIRSPFIPTIEPNSETSNNPDTTNFDSCFTRLPINSCFESASPNVTALSPSRIGQSVNSLANAFKDFTFVEQSHLQEKLKAEGMEEDNGDMREDARETKPEEQAMLEQHILNLHDTILPNIGTSTSPSGLSSSLLFK